MDNNKQKECNMDTRITHLWPRCWRQGLGLTALALLMALSNPVLAAIPFELDGNAVSSTGEDWNSLNVPSGYSGQASVRTGLVIDRPEPALMGIFTGGGSKDEQDITQWRWRSGAPPAKDDLSHAYAAQFTDNGHEILVFGMDRYDTSGDAQLGFWFLKGGGTPVAGGTFSGAHEDGDVLVLVNFSNGGTVPTIQVFKWLNGAVVSQGAGQQVLCDGGIPAGKQFCGITNAASTPAPWPYVNKDAGSTTNFPSGAFFEGAIDLGNTSNGPCFTNFLTESRSSTSITAVLKDFAAHSFPACSVKVTKVCSDPTLSADEASIAYTITGKVENDGGGLLHEVTLTDEPAIPDPFTVVDCTTHEPIPGASFPLTTLAGNQIVCYKNTFSVPLANNGPSDTVTVTAKTAAGGTATVDDEASFDCPPLQVEPALTIEKTCTSEVAIDGAQVVAKVKASVEICNTGDSQLKSVAVTDDHAGNLSGPTSIAKGLCGTYTGEYFPTTPDEVNGEIPTNPSDVKFTDTATVNAVDILGRTLTPASDSDTCPLCVCTDCNN